MYILFAVLSLTGLGLTLGFGLGTAARFFKVDSDPLVDELEAMMPGSQCGQCGFPGCRPAAEALAAGEAPPTLCPPGGPSLAQRLADKLGVALDTGSLVEAVPMVAQVNEETCIGCTRCFKVCPTDAIVGASRQIHAVVADACIACSKCVEVCPTECLQLRPVKVTLYNWRWPKPQPQWSEARA
jgi:electron transport complex protein RnfB